MRLAGAGDPGGSSVVVETMRWGLVPSYQARDPTPADHFVAFNARAETLAERPTFGRLLRRNRGVALIDGFYEWRAEGGRGRDAVKQPYYLGNDISLADCVIRPSVVRFDNCYAERGHPGVVGC